MSETEQENQQVEQIQNETAPALTENERAERHSLAKAVQAAALFATAVVTQDLEPGSRALAFSIVGAISTYAEMKYQTGEKSSLKGIARAAMVGLGSALVVDNPQYVEGFNYTEAGMNLADTFKPHLPRLAEMTAWGVFVAGTTKYAVETGKNMLEKAKDVVGVSKEFASKAKRAGEAAVHAFNEPGAEPVIVRSNRYSTASRPPVTRKRRP